MELFMDIFGNLEFTIELILAELLFLRYTNRKKSFAVAGTVALAICAAVSLLCTYRALLTLGSIGVMVRCFMILALTMLGIFLCFDCSGFHVLLYSVCAYTVQHMAFASHQLIKMLWDALLPGMPLSNVMNIVSTVVVFGMVYWFAYRCFIRKITESECTIDMKKVALLATGMLLIVVVISVLCYGMDPVEYAVCRGLSVLGCLLGLAMTAEQFHSRKLEMELEIIQRQAELKKDYYELLRDSIEATNMLCHDFKHQLAQFRMHADSVAQLPEAVLREMENSINNYDAIAKTGNEVMDTVLTEKSLICQKEGIRFTYMADSESTSIMEHKDIYALFGNALDNAIEAVRHLEDSEKRVINLSVVRIGPFLHIRIYNYFDGTLQMVDGLPMTTKSDKLLHGYGMKSIRLTTEKYDGQMLVSTENQIFGLSIVLPVVS